MTNFEMVETLREKANVTYEEARDALEAANWDLLDAMLLLEKEGKVPESSASFSTRPEAEEEEAPRRRNPDGVRSAIRWLGCALRKLVYVGNTNSLVVARHGNELFSLPVTVCVILLLCSVWTVLIVMALSLFFGVRYSFRGPQLGKEAINNAMNRAADAAENMKEEIRKQENSSEESK